MMVPNVHAPSEEKFIIQRAVFTRNQSSSFNHLSKYHMKIL